MVVDSDGSDSENDFYGYHGYVTQSAVGSFAYAVIAYPDEQWRLTVTASHELAEAVTDPQVNAVEPSRPLFAVNASRCRVAPKSAEKSNKNGGNGHIEGPGDIGRQYPLPHELGPQHGEEPVDPHPQERTVDNGPRAADESEGDAEHHERGQRARGGPMGHRRRTYGLVDRIVNTTSAGEARRGCLSVVVG